ncbi:MAG: nucleotide exchange factor GrpE, partial [Synergistaceae bacterium]|nr:nucleotide exchange factor GrpE [Synergistaceae bacterium]
LDLLKERGVTVIPAEGVNFDPSVHEAIETSDVDDPSMDGKVLSELSRGYRAEERVLRPARVIVGRMNSGAAARQHAATDIQEESR